MVEYVTSKLKRVFTAIGGGSTVEEVKETQYLKSEEIKVNMERAENRRKELKLRDGPPLYREIPEVPIKRYEHGDYVKIDTEEGLAEVAEVLNE